MRAAVAYMLSAMLAMPALAKGYSEYAAAMNAEARDEYDKAIAHFTSALAASDLAPEYLPVVHFGRGVAYLRLEQCAAALTDLDEAVKAQPWSARMRAQRANAKACLGKYDEALADASAAISLRPTDSALYRMRGRIAFEAGLFAVAPADFEKALTLDPKDATAALWLGSTQQRLGTFDGKAFDARAADADAGDWPRPLFDLLRGRLKDETSVTAAISRQPGMAAFRQCQWDFFSGEWHLDHGDAATARARLQSAAAGCPPDAGLKHAAQSELARLPQ